MRVLIARPCHPGITRGSWHLLTVIVKRIRAGCGSEPSPNRRSFTYTLFGSLIGCLGFFLAGVFDSFVFRYFPGSFHQNPNRLHTPRIRTARTRIEFQTINFSRNHGFVLLWIASRPHVHCRHVAPCGGPSHGGTTIRLVCNHCVHTSVTEYANAFVHV